MIYDDMYGISSWRDVVEIVSLLVSFWLMCSNALWVGTFVLSFIFVLVYWVVRA